MRVVGSARDRRPTRPETPQDGEDEITLLRHADTAMYEAKLEGGNVYKIFSPTMNERLGI